MSEPLRLPRALFAMSRPDQVALIAAVYGLGVLVGIRRGAATSPEAVLVGLACLLPVAVSVHWADEWADHETDRLTTPTAFSGGSGALERFDLPRSVALRAAVVALLVGVVATAAAVAADSLPAAATLPIVVVAVLGWAYSLPPVALAWRGLGELDNALLGGVVLPGIGVAVATGGLSAGDLALFVPFGALVFANVLATAWPDRSADAAVGKRTLAVILPADRLRTVYWSAVVGAAVWLAALWALDALPTVVLVASLPALALWLPAARTFTRRRSPFRSVAAMVAFAVAQAAGWLFV